ncbi:MAG: hypothetical protein A2Z15_06030 [Chloroflexi bacterium RBG_16_50_11]|nr:MAG: hypothetical protein A2Z15_06030 [Chloroflexi bacterium RBG_16_50_11]
MVDDITDIQAYYDKRVEQEHGRLERHQQERDITWRYLDKYLPPRGKILDIGAATGAYAIPLAKRGYSVNAVDLAPNNIKTLKKRVSREMLEKKVTCFVADGRELKGVPGKDYNAVLLMGPLYHLVLKEDREKAVQEAFERLRPGGIIFSTFISRYGIWSDIMHKAPRMIELQADVRSIIRRGRDSDHPAPEIQFRAYFAKVPEILKMHKSAGFKKLVLAGVEPANTVADEAYCALKGEHRKLWLDLLFTISTEPSIIGASAHILYIGVKE